MPEKANLSFHKSRFDAGIRLHQTVRAIRKSVIRGIDYFLFYLYLRGFLFVCLLAIRIICGRMSNAVHADDECKRLRKELNVN